VSAYAGADTCTGELTPDRVGGAFFEVLGQNRYRHCGRMRHEQVQAVGFAVDLNPLGIEVGAHGAWCSRVLLSMASVNTGRRFLVTNTRWACSSDTLCRVRR
jgi:hypothetical protein